MQRLFSTFPNEWPGAGLLLLRLALGGTLLADAAMIVLNSGAAPAAILAGIQVLVGGMIIVGLWTPITATAAFMLQIGTALIAMRAMELELLRAAMAASLALLGPGAWSFDARLFGRRRVEIKPPRGG